MAKEPIFVKKITMKTIAGLNRDIDKAATVKHFLDQLATHPDFAAVSGDVTGFGTKPGVFGENYYFNGTFIAINRKTGEVFKAPKIYLPNDLAENVVAAFNGRVKEGDAGNGVHFSAHIILAEDKGGATGYTFVSKPIANPQSINREAELQAVLTGLPPVKQLAAPAKKAS